MSMWEPFTERARRSVALAQEEAMRLGNQYIGTEHILLGIVSESESMAAKMLAARGVNLSKVRQEVEMIVGRGAPSTQTEMVHTPRAKRVYELAFDEARLLNCNYVGTEHLLLGIIKENEGVAARTLSNLHVDTENLAEEIRKSIRAERTPGTKQRPPTVRVAGGITGKGVSEETVTDGIVALCESRGWLFSGGVVKANEDNT